MSLWEQWVATSIGACIGLAVHVALVVWPEQVLMVLGVLAMIAGDPL